MDKPIVIGRTQEQKLLREVSLPGKAHLLAITGRRRVGKTYLIRTFFRDRIDFTFNGVLNAGFKTQLQQFDYTLREKERKNSARKAPENWLEAFRQLSEYFDRQKKKRHVLFIDEFPWLDTHRSNFLGAFDWFWNTWASQRDILVIVCGSATSWMIRRIVNNRGGLHNRITKHIHLKPFTLHETETFLRYRHIALNRYQITTLYMALGGVPHYLEEVAPGESAMQAIQRMCFEKDGLLYREFDNLYHALFQDATAHILIVKALSRKRKGLSRAAILTLSKLKDGGTFSKNLEELEWSGFIESYTPFGKVKKDKLYRLTDEFSLFYLTFMDKKKNVNWEQLSAGAAWNSWSGYTFESVCIKHLPQVKRALGISAVYTETSSFISKSSDVADGTQIDLLIDRRDQVINICEMKFSDQPFVLTNAYAAGLRQKIGVFRQTTGTKKALFLTFITSFGVVPNEHSTGFVMQQVQLDDLFREK